MSKATLVYIFLFLGISVLFSQEKDSTMVALEKILAAAPNDSLKVAAYIEIGDYQLRRDLSNTELYLNKALKIIQFSNNVYDSKLHKAEISKQLGVVQRRRGNYEKALERYYEALPVFEAYKDSADIASSLHNIGIVQGRLLSVNEAIKSLQKSIAINSKLKRFKSIGKSYNSLAVIHSKNKKYDSAIYYYELAEKQYEISAYTDGMFYTRANKGNALLMQKKYQQALKLYREYLDYVYKVEDIRGKAVAHFYLAGVSYRTKKFDSALHHINRTIDIAKAENLDKRLVKAYKRRSRIYREMNDFESAMRDFIYADKADKKLISLEKVKNISQLELNYEFERERLLDSLNFAKQKEFLVVENEKESFRKRWYLSVAILALIAGFFGIQYFRRRWKTSRLLQAELNKKLYRTEEESQQRVTQLHSEIDSLSHEIDSRKEEITELMTESLQHIKTKEKLVDDLKKLATNDETINIQNIISDLKSSSFEDSRLTLIKSHLEELNYDFFKKIKAKHPNLTKIDLEICSYLRLSFGRQEIAKLRFTSVEAVKKSRNRLRKRMNLSPETDLEAYVKSI
ncbi:MAG: tetratricopeptide repeat protein [Bacteroidota bacterium]